MAIQHVVLSKFKADVDEAGQAKIFNIARGYLATIPQAKNAAVGPPINSRLSRGYTYGMVVTFDDSTALGAYLQHPQHLALIQALNPYTEGMMVYQIEVPDGVMSKL
ncbi:hypothetical protein EIP91_010117 [Steccherinum ochraceum]|uniref:Stress-response A/B barrel domain-containing protein n=1 Tax=Steccherinum ochraceum TaxID=92696 RepID=A0A4R0RRH9_9APHY|nr:hypothetical protein EIP91_010117 [Steccherinum ochraceum]